MKKSLIAMVAVMVMASAFATPVWTYVSTESKGGAITDYSAYYCTKAQAETMFGSGNIADISKYLTKDEESYKKGMDDLEALGATYKYTSYGIDEETGEYVFSKYLQSALNGDFVAIVAKSNESSGAKDDVRVFSATASQSGTLEFNPTAGKGSATEWATVPEPTSGVLLLLGFAALSLRRKRVISC